MTEAELKSIEAKLAAIDALSIANYGTAAEFQAEKSKLRAEMWPDVRRLLEAVRASKSSPPPEDDARVAAKPRPPRVTK